MCDFISYIEVDGHICYLEDVDVYSSEGKKLLKDCRDNDLLGHGAIRRYFCLGPGKGESFEHRDFWNKEKFPKEIADKIDNFEKHWSRMLKQCLTTEDIKYIVNNAPEDVKNKIVKITDINEYAYLNSYNKMFYEFKYDMKRSNIETLRLIRNISDKDKWKQYADSIAKMLLHLDYNSSDLEWIIKYSPLYRDKACEILLSGRYDGELDKKLFWSKFPLTIIRHGGSFYAERMIDKIVKGLSYIIGIKLAKELIYSHELEDDDFINYKIIAFEFLLKIAKSNDNEEFIVRTIQDVYLYYFYYKLHKTNNKVLRDMFMDEIRDLLLQKYCKICKNKLKVRTNYFNQKEVQFCSYCKFKDMGG